jgi:hypothetical protein
VVWDSYLAHVSSAEDDDKSSSLEANIWGEEVVCEPLETVTWFSC